GAAERIAAELGGAALLPAVKRRVEPTTSDARLGRCDLVLESVVEDAAVKRQVFARLEPHLAPGTVLATNTSTIPIAILAAGLAEPQRFCGLHFFHPVRRRPLVEIVRGPNTSDRTIAAAVAFAQRIDKVPIVVADGPGFLVNRLLMPYLTEALELLLDGATLEQVERAATQFGMALGPLRLLDEIGLDTALLAGRVLYEAFPERAAPSPLLVAMYKAKRWGRKTGAGFFSYPPGLDQDAPGQPDPAVDALLAPWVRAPKPHTDEAIVYRLLLPMVLEATRVLAEGKVAHPRDIDRAVVLGLGFPAARRGLLAWADTLGPARLLELLRPLEPLGPRMHPTEWLLDMVRRGRTFCDRDAAHLADPRCSPKRRPTTSR
ncbi:MAG: 3-hydroxyacyl-CoA dehydrogenase NAD-binding domain-containing protein, partial [Thermoguttaceae bacterium]|nr:3-hydroxyacyl-CoA dehydrogenase NAD-binding domain-containing protein [Thermoguttaceae bacterium]